MKKAKTFSKVAMVVIISIFAMFNIMYIIEAQGKIKCFGASMILDTIKTKSQANLNLALFLFMILGLIITYLIIIAKEKKKTETDSKDIKKTFIFIAIVTIIAGIILPNNSSDVYYYIASGRADATYGYDVFDVNFLKIQEDLKDDKIIADAPGWDQTFTYGIVFALICKIIGSIRTDNLLVLLYAFKILNIIVHILNCYLIYKMTKSKRMTLIYGLNPLVLFEGIINCHNDIYMVFFILLALYFKKEKKIHLAVISIALGTLIKYIPIILLPYIIWEKGNLKKMILYGIEFLAIFFGLNLLYLGDITKILSALVQTKRYANSLYLTLIVEKVKVDVGKVALIGTILFCIIYFVKVVLKINKETDSKTYLHLFLYFFLLVITNFRCWYLMILFGLLPDLSEKYINETIAITLIAEFANFVIYYLGEKYIYGEYYFFSVIALFAVYVIMQRVVENCKKPIKEA